MCVVESGRHALSSEVNAARARRCERQHLGARADCEHPAAGERQRLDLALARPHGQDVAVEQDRLWRSVPAGEGSGARAEPGGDEGAAAEAFGHDFICVGAGACE